MTDKTDKRLELIAQLLAKAERTTPAEAEALTEHATRLMLKYGIEQARIDERRAKLGQASEAIIEVSLGWEGRYARAMLDLGHAVVLALGTLRPLQSIRERSTRLYIVGFESDVRQAEVLIRSLELQSTVAMRAWWAGRRADYRFASDGGKAQARIGFLRGFAVGVGQRISANRLQEVGEAGTGTDLVLVSRRSRVDEYVDGLGVPNAAADRRKALDVAAAVAGARAGREANTGEREVTMGRALTMGVPA